ncbi:MAG: GNAT family N-acetyltransferase [Deltaproteobacteria bacterium]|nr:GNAT family N-acetyltransferase [Deltaproteobacteria bacterium]
MKKILKTRRLVLRPIRLSDAAKIFNSYAQDPKVTRYVTWPCHRSINETRNFIKACITVWRVGTGFPWAITLTKDKKLIGMIDLRFSDTRPFSYKRHMMDVGYVVMRPEWNKGYVTEALKEVLAFAFSIPGVYRVWAICDVKNRASARVMEKAGMTREGRLSKYTFHPNIDDRPCDVYLYAKTQK